MQPANFDCRISRNHVQHDDDEVGGPTNPASLANLPFSPSPFDRSHTPYPFSVGQLKRNMSVRFAGCVSVTPVRFLLRPERSACYISPTSCRKLPQ